MILNKNGTARLNIISYAFHSERILGNKRKAICNSCQHPITESSKTGTGNASRHIGICTQAIKDGVLLKYQELKGNNATADDDAPIKHPKKSQDSYCFYIIKYLVVMCALPFRLVECEGFKIFMDFMTNSKYKNISNFTLLHLIYTSLFFIQYFKLNYAVKARYGLMKSFTVLGRWNIQNTMMVSGQAVIIGIVPFVFVY